MSAAFTCSSTCATWHPPLDIVYISITALRDRKTAEILRQLKNISHRDCGTETNGFIRWRKCRIHLLLYISNKKRLPFFDELELLVADVGIDFCSIKLADVEPAACPAAEDESFLAFAEDAVEKLEAMHIFRRLIQLSCAALVDSAFVNLTVVLSLRNYQQGTGCSFRIEVPRNHECIGCMRLGKSKLLAPVLRKRLTTHRIPPDQIS